MDKFFNKIIVATCNADEQFKRIKSKNDWSDEEIKMRLKNQLDSKIKEEKGDVVINTGCDMTELKVKTEKLYQYLKNQEQEKLFL
jgi:dephospho-CoA kinase